MSYLETTAQFYSDVAETPEVGLCCKTAIYGGAEIMFDDRAGHILQKGIPSAVCDKTAAKLGQAFSHKILVTDSTWHYVGGGCC